MVWQRGAALRSGCFVHSGGALNERVGAKLLHRVATNPCRVVPVSCIVEFLHGLCQRAHIPRGNEHASFRSDNFLRTTARGCEDWDPGGHRFNQDHTKGFFKTRVDEGIGVPQRGAYLLPSQLASKFDMIGDRKVLRKPF